MTCCPQETHWYGTQHTNSDPFRSLFNTAAGEKEDMMVLNNRLADVFTRLEKLRSEGGKGKDDCSFAHALQCLQDEIKKIKICYENQISKMRRDYELLTAEKNEMLGNFNQCKMSYESLQNRFDDVERENRKLNEDIGELKCYTALKEREMAELTNCLHSIKCELELTRPKCCKYEQEADSFRKQWECERRARQDCDDKFTQLVEKLNFETRMHDQQVRDMEERLTNAHDIIECLQAKLRELSTGGETNNINELLQRIRESMMDEFVKYKKDTEEAVSKALNEIKSELEQSMKDKEQLIAERDSLAGCVSRLQGQISELQAQQLQQSIQCEKAQTCKAIRDLECKVLGLQDSIMLKIREVSAAREVQTALRSEIESYKILLEREEKRLMKTCLPPVNKTTTGNTNPQYAPHGGFPSGAPPPFAGGCGPKTDAGEVGSSGSGAGISENCGCSGSSPSCRGGCSSYNINSSRDKPVNGCAASNCGGGAPACCPHGNRCCSLLDAKHFGSVQKTPVHQCPRTLIHSTSRPPPIAGRVGNRKFFVSRDFQPLSDRPAPLELSS